MSVVRIKEIKAREILDSRGHPTVEVEVLSDNLLKASAGVPSGASKGRFEALELRDNDPKRFHGRGVLKACRQVLELSKKLKNHPLDSLEAIDQKLIEWGGGVKKKHLGANATLGISLACARLIAQIKNKPFYGEDNYVLPVPLINVLNGGAHADNNLDIQEFMIVPHGFSSFKEALRAGAEVFQTLRGILKSKGFYTALGDEGGIAPRLKSNEEALKFLMQAIEQTGYKAGGQISLALDSAASSFFKDGFYHWEGEKINADDLISIYGSWIKNYPIKSIEDGLEEEAWPDWVQWTRLQGENLQIVGDDLFVTHVQRIQKGVSIKAANALLVKANQIGTLTETRKAVELARSHRYRCILSHRSGETEDTSIADLSLSLGCSQIKTGGVCRSERTAKYNQLLRIEEELGAKAQYKNIFSS